MHPVSCTKYSSNDVIDLINHGMFENIIGYIIDVSNKLNKNLSVITLELIGTLVFLLCISSDMETNSFTWLKTYKPISNLKLK